tara:strand:+ start:12272 stop:13129 length:858 start_codon:yes stop_codon:yes gene_type:complete
MVQSMTSYGRHSISKKYYSIETEIKSLNSKFFDFNIRNSPQIKLDENKIRSILKKKLTRGKIDVTISIYEKSKDHRKIIDSKKFKNLYSEIKSLARSHNDDIILNNTLKFSEKLLASENINLSQNIIYDSINKAANACIKYRVKEGKTILKDLQKKIKSIHKDLKNIILIDKKQIKNKRKALKEKILDIKGLKVDQNRLEQEVFFYLDKIDINEEINRLKSNLYLFEETMKSKTSQGKKLNFICQEIGREINTIGSKCSEFAIQKKVIEMKNNLEKIKEENYNIV